MKKLSAAKIMEKKNTIIPMPEKSFIAYFFYDAKEKQLYMTFRASKKQYRYSIHHVTFQELMNAANRGSYIAQNIIKEKECEFVREVPAQEINDTLTAYTNYYKNFVAR